MKQYLSYIICMLGLVLFACSGCEETDSLTTVSGFQVTLTEAETEEARSTPSEIGKPAVSQFQLKIVNTVTQKTVYDDTYKSGFIAAGQGIYTITATCGTDAVLAVDAPYYKGETTEVEVPEKSSAPVEVSVPCRVANALASVFVKEGDEQKFAELYSEYKVEVAVGTSVTSLSPGDGRSAYYKAGTIPTFTFKGTLRSNGLQVSKTLEGDALADAANFAAGQHVKITLGYQPTQPGWMPTIEKVAIETVTVSQTLPMEWLPAPKISSTGFDATNTLDVYETETGKSATIDFAVASPLQDLEFTLDFQDEVLATAAINKSYQLSQMTSSEIANLKNIGISLPVVGEKYPSISLTSNLLDDLLAQNGITVKNQITIHSVKANNRTQKDNAPVTFTIATHQPEFSVSVLPGNIWTKEFTVEECAVVPGKGNLAKMKEKGLLYQYRLIDGEWTNLSDNTHRIQTFVSHPEDLSYQVRAIYRNCISSNTITISLEEPKVLPNGDMNDWTASTRYTQPYYLPWSDDGTEWWNTNNNATMPQKYSTYIDYKCFPTTTYEEPGYGGTGKAVVIRSVAVNGANSQWAHFGDTRGMLFAGTISDDGTITEGRNWASRPTALKFRYKYESYDNERFGVYCSILSDGVVIGKGEYLSQNGVSVTAYPADYLNVPIDYTDIQKKATEIRICFTSVATSDNPSTRKQTITIPAGSYKIYGGSVLIVDDISLVYDR